jgi:hypothetical protein
MECPSRANQIWGIGPWALPTATMVQVFDLWPTREGDATTPWVLPLAPRALPTATMVEPVGLTGGELLDAAHPFADRFCEEKEEHAGDRGHDDDLEILRRHLLNSVGVEISGNETGDEVPE